MFKKLGVAGFTIRDFVKDEAGINESMAKLKALGYDELQIAGGFKLGDAEMWAKAGKENGISFVGTHSAPDALFADPDLAIKEHEILGTTNIGVGSIPIKMTESFDQFKAFVESANEFAAKIGKQGFKFTYHHHAFEFAAFDGVRMMDYLIDNLDPANTSFVLDTYWVQYAGGDPSEWIRRLAGRIDILHLKDMAMALPDGKWEQKQVITEVGSGNINFDPIIKAAEETNIKYYAVEQDTCPGNPFDSLEKSIGYIKAKGYMG